MRIALDAIGGDFGLKPNIEGAIQAAAELGCKVALVGPRDGIKAELASRGVSGSDARFEIVDAPETIGMDEDAVASCRTKPQCSIMLANELVAKGKADAVISAGHSGAAMVAALWHLKRLPGVLRPAIACPLPTARGTSVMLDGGANTECKPWYLVQFAVMGAQYAQHVLKINNPTIGILSNGEEDSKGNELVRETIPLLRASGLNFKGPIEGRDIPAGTTDVIVCDGFTGNVALKVMEGVASTVFSMLKAQIESTVRGKIGGLMIRPAARALKARMSYDEHGGAPLLGVDGVSIIAHGKSNAKAIFNAHRVAQRLVEGNANKEIRAGIDRLKSSLELAKVGG